MPKANHAHNMGAPDSRFQAEGSDPSATLSPPRRNLLAGLGAALVTAGAPAVPARAMASAAFASPADQLRAIADQLHAFAYAHPTVPLPASAEPAGADAALVQHCGRIMQIDAELMAIFRTRLTLEDEARTEPALDRLDDELEHHLAAIDRLPAPATLAGAKAMAGAALATAMKGRDGKPCAQDGNDSERLALMVARFLVGRAA